MRINLSKMSVNKHKFKNRLLVQKNINVSVKEINIFVKKEFEICRIMLVNKHGNVRGFNTYINELSKEMKGKSANCAIKYPSYC